MSNLLRPSEAMALLVAQSKLDRGENPGPNVTAALVIALERLEAEHDG